LSKDKESRVAKLILENMSDDDPEKKRILEEAQKIYVLNLTCHREGYKTRVDKGVKKPPETHGNTEAAWQRRRDISLSSAVQCSTDSSNNNLQAIQARLESVDAGETWTDRHDKMLGKQDKKIERRKIDAMLDQGDVCGEATEVLQEKVQQEHRARLKRAKEKQANTRSINAVTRKKTHQFQNVTFFWGDVNNDDKLRRAVAELPGCSVVDDRLVASHFVVADLKEPGMRVTWLAKLMGGRIFLLQLFSVNMDHLLHLSQHT
jgi:uncharacterized membrane protein